MANINCSACEDLRQTSPEFVLHGLSDEMCASIQNGTGLNPSDDHTTCEDLNDINDCFINNMASEISAYESCDWKSFMRKFIPNLWVTLKALTCAVCKAACAFSGLAKLVDYLAAGSGGLTFVRYYRDLGAGQDVPYWENLVDGWSSRNHGGDLEIYMDSGGASGGSQPADRDYVVLISNCTNIRGFYDLNGFVTFYSSGDTRPIADIRSHLAQHPSIDFYTKDGEPTGQLNNFSWTTSGAVVLKKGEHIKVNFYVSDVHKAPKGGSTMPEARLHQFVLTWIPINASEALDPSKILDC